MFGYAALITYIIVCSRLLKYNFCRYCDRRKWVFLLITLAILKKFYIVMGAQMGYFPGNLGALRRGRPKWPTKTELQNAISQRPVCVKFGCDERVVVVINPFGKELQNFSNKLSLTTKTDFLSRLCGCFVMCLQT